MRRGAWALTLWLVAPSLGAQVRHRRPLNVAPNINYGFDNNGSSSGCRDYNCGSRCYNGHTGTDYPVGIGTTVVATADGTVTATNNGCANYGGLGNSCGGRCGNYVQITHSDGTSTIYCHMQLNSIAVSRGQRVRCGQTVGRSASSGNSSGPHLHVGWRRNGVSTDSFRGRCTGSPGMWQDQNPYPQSPGATCGCVPSTEVCNGRDDDCDGRVDEGLSRSCYTGPAGTQGRGSCRAGTQTCSNGNWGACAGQVLPTREDCDNRDDDCDGRTDDGLSRSCYAGPAGTAGRGICRNGSQTCARGVWGACAGQVVPRAETCNMLDDDCDGRADDGVCAVDAGPPRDAASDAGNVNDVNIARDVAADLPSDLGVDAGDDAGAEDAGGADAGVEDAGAEDVVEFDDVPEDFDAGDISPDIPVTEAQEGCGCHAPGQRARGAGAGWLLLGAALAARRRSRKRA
ncbi:MAG: M23 family metallopeptidase [Myxococcales bacterium]|nr:M23 family metallopeptidase [Myxococcales bacterium]